jgi:hypothetical protein
VAYKNVVLFYESSRKRKKSIWKGKRHFQMNGDPPVIMRLDFSHLKATQPHLKSIKHNWLISPLTRAGIGFSEAG